MAVATVCISLVSCATGTTINSLDENTPVGVELFLPDGEGPFPAVVLMHGCAGTEAGMAGLARHANYLNAIGIAGLVVDSFSHRWVSPRKSCSGDGFGIVHRRTLDALAALRYLHEHPQIRDDAIGIQGASQGGTVVMHALGDNFIIEELSPTPGFAAGLAFYPFCYHYNFQSPPSVPLLILIGSSDDWTPAANCQTWVDRHADHEPAPEIVVIEGAEHSFDLPGVSMVQFMGHTVAGDPRAYEIAKDHQRRFFLEHLAR